MANENGSAALILALVLVIAIVFLVAPLMVDTGGFRDGLTNLCQMSGC